MNDVCSEGGSNPESHRDTKQPVNEPDLPLNIGTGQPSHLPFAKHVHGFITLNCPSCRIECPESLLRIHTFLYESMVLLDDVVQVLHRSVPATA